MSQANKDHVIDLLTTGVMNYVALIAEGTAVPVGEQIFRTVREAFQANIRPTDTCNLAFPGMIIRPEIRVECFTMILADRVIVAWQKGIFKKTTVSRVVPKSSIKRVFWQLNYEYSRQGILMLTIVADETVNIGLFTDQRPMADAIARAIDTR